VEIQSHFKTYKLNFVDRLNLDELINRDETFFVIDKKVFDLYEKELPVFPEGRLFLLEAVEEKKNITTVLEICEKMTSMMSKRNTHLVSIGGGIVQDITGFVANCLYRGIRWTFYPSTLLAACDSCIGGKSSLNYEGFKNLLGSFYPPDDIHIYTPFFQTLSARDFCSGLGEVVKFNVISGVQDFNAIEADLDHLLPRDGITLMKYITKSLLFKKRYIEVDEFDHGERVLLNFAHTFGHAFEVVSTYQLPHGSAVALGMIAANSISVQRGFIPESYAEQIARVCRKILTNVAICKEWFTLLDILAAIHKDKKQTGENITAVLMKNDMSLGVFKDIETREISKAIENVLCVMKL
jgi:3-dehydroquinate synthase